MTGSLLPSCNFDAISPRDMNDLGSDYRETERRRSAEEEADADGDIKHLPPPLLPRCILMASQKTIFLAREIPSFLASIPSLVVVVRTQLPVSGSFLMISGGRSRVR